MNRIRFILAVFALFSFSATLLAAPLPDTGQTESYTETHGEDSDYLINPPSYTKLDERGNDLPDSAASWAMVRDNVTGLIWEVKQHKDGTQNYSDPHDADNTYTWYDSNSGTNGGNAGWPGDGTDTEDFIAALNAAYFGGYSSWRLPTIKELASLTDLGRYNPAIDTEYFPNTLSSSYYWSSTTDVLIDNSAGAWGVDFNYGFDCHGDKFNEYYVRAVRGGH